MIRKLTDYLGLLLLVFSLLFYFLFKLPSVLSVTCGNVNEGYYFGYGQHLLEGKHLYQDIYAARGPLFILFYALVVKIFGFGTGAIIATHVLHTNILIFIGIVLYLVSNKIFQNDFYSGLSVLFWVLLQTSMIGNWGHYLELESNFSFEAEYFCVLFSLLSIYFIFQQKTVFSFLSGIFAVCSLMFKGSGAVAIVAIIFWVIYLFLFNRELFSQNKRNILFFVLGLILTLSIILFALYIHNGELSAFFSQFFSLGYYSNFSTKSIQNMLLALLDFIFRFTLSFGNLFLFLFAFLFFILGLIKDTSKAFFPLIAIWGIGSVCAVIVPGKYASYYYVLVWPSVALSLVYGIKEVFSNFKFLNKKYIKISFSIFIALFFLQRYWVIYPDYKKKFNEFMSASLFNQPESFQDPVNLKKSNPKRPPALKIADKINSYLPDKNSTFFIFNFVKGHQDFSPFIYIYAKRSPSTTVYSDWLHVERLATESSEKLVKDLQRWPPKIIILPNSLFMREWQKSKLVIFFQSLIDFIQENYHLKDKLNYKYSDKEDTQVHLVFERKT